MPHHTYNLHSFDMYHGCQTMERQDAIISARIPKSLKKLIEEFVRRDCHLNESDFIRDAIREKIQREAPELYARLFKEAEN